MSMSFKLRNAGWNCVRKGSIFLRAFPSFCSSDVFPSENLTSLRCFSAVCESS